MLLESGCAARANVIGGQHQPRARDIFGAIMSYIISLYLKSLSSFGRIRNQERLSLCNSRRDSALML